MFGARRDFRKRRSIVRGKWAQRQSRNYSLLLHHAIHDRLGSAGKKRFGILIGVRVSHRHAGTLFAQVYPRWRSCPLFIKLCGGGGGGGRGGGSGGEGASQPPDIIIVVMILLCFSALEASPSLLPPLPHPPHTLSQLFASPAPI